MDSLRGEDMRTDVFSSNTTLYDDLRASLEKPKQQRKGVTVFNIGTHHVLSGVTTR